MCLRHQVLLIQLTVYSKVFCACNLVTVGNLRVPYKAGNFLTELLLASKKDCAPLR
jgi:hypothetical protein